MIMALVVLLGFGTLFMFAFDEGAQGADISIEATIARQAKEIESLRSNIERNKTRLAKAPELKQRATSFTVLARSNQSRDAELDSLREGVSSAKGKLDKLMADFEAYKDEYRAAARAAAKGEELESLETTDGKVYQNVSIREVTAVGMQIRHQAGQTRIPFERLPEDIQDRFQFDPKQKEQAIAAELERRRAHEQAVAKSNQQVAEQKQEQREAEQVAEMERKQRRAAQLRQQILSLDMQIKQLNIDIENESRKKLSRAPQMRQKLTTLRNNQSSMRSELSQLESEL